MSIRSVSITPATAVLPRDLKEVGGLLRMVV
jgi:hypothetical protein